MRKHMTDAEAQLAEALSNLLTTDFEAQTIVNFTDGYNGGIEVLIVELDEERRLSWSWPTVAKALASK